LLLGILGSSSDDCSPELNAMTFHQPYRARRYPSVAREHSFAFVRWTLDAIAILIVSSALFIGFFVSSIGLLHG
jgi:hypothetical protein